MSTKPASGDPIVEVREVHKEYQLGKTTVKALDGVDLTLGAGEFAVIAGPSGSGKTTLLNLIGCVDVPSRGDVKMAGQSTRALGDRALTQLRLRKIGFIFQSFNLVEVLNVVQNVELPLQIAGGLGAGERRDRVHAMLERVGLQGHHRHRPAELSGGQRQRVAIARALVTRPALVLADEPTANLDSATGASILELMHELNESDNTTFLFSTHDPEVMAHAARRLELRDGRITADNTA